MTLDELKKIVYKDLPVNKEHLDTESLRNQDLYAKYLDYKTNFEFLLAKAKGEYTKMWDSKIYNTSVGLNYTFR